MKQLYKTSDQYLIKYFLKHTVAHLKKSVIIYLQIQIYFQKSFFMELLITGHYPLSSFFTQWK